MREIEPEFEAAGVAVRFVVIGDAAKAQKFCAQWAEAKRCLPDPDKTSYKAMGLEEYDLRKLFTDKALGRRRLQNKAAGFKQNWFATRLKDGAQLPGAAYFDADGVLRWLYRGIHPGDLPPMREMLDAVTAESWKRAPQ